MGTYHSCQGKSYRTIAIALTTYILYRYFSYTKGIRIRRRIIVTYHTARIFMSYPEFMRCIRGYCKSTCRLPRSSTYRCRRSCSSLCVVNSTCCKGRSSCLGDTKGYRICTTSNRTAYRYISSI